MSPINSIQRWKRKQKMGDILLLQPASSDKRKTLSDMFIEPKGAGRPDILDIKKRLREIRDYSLSNQVALVKDLITVLNTNPDTKASFATDALEATKSIKDISGNVPIVINNSTVITRELLPHLNKDGYQVIDSYLDELKPFDNRFKEYWQLPDIPFESTWNSLKKPVHLNLLRKISIQNNRVKNFTGLIGLNAISASDGAVIMLQHMSNIKIIFEQARKIIFVVGLDKIMQNRDEALFIAKCMAVFGIGAIPLTIKGRNLSDKWLETLPFYQVSQKADNIHIILLDNGRSRVLKSGYKDLLACIGCRACIKACPASSRFLDGPHLSPRDYIYSFISGQIPSVDRCLQCKICESNCPLNIDIPGMVLKGKRLMTKKRTPLSDRLLSNVDILEQIGSYVPWLVTMVSKNRLLRGLLEKFAGISSERRIPDIKGRTFFKQFRSLEERTDTGREDV